MSACKMQCGNEPEADCGPCLHRDKSYPWPGAPGGKMFFKFKLQPFDIVDVTAEEVSINDAFAQSWLVRKYYWSHWEQ